LPKEGYELGDVRLFIIVIYARRKGKDSMQCIAVGSYNKTTTAVTTKER